MPTEYAGHDKSAYRTKLSAMRNGLAEELRAEWSNLACQHLAQWLEGHSYRTVMAYVSFRSELNINEFIEWCWKKKIEVLLPRCVKADRSMKLHSITGWNQLVAGAYGIMEPSPDRSPIKPVGTVPDVVVVPGLAFDRTGGRLGYGGGYYDRFAEAVSDAGTKPVWIGAGFEAQVMNDLVPSDSHDLRLDGLVTERVFTTIRQ
ncbi:5-formyltetrahydrofolate cyclo-ligase [Paenibacillus sp. 1011MAR3C5]|uniref:5-formyltetrahydrofolate cyclo-ligase n=1 Tax=Paenibacillus sp. 1011MAR3C5 TaxID=1675787 RepID=UPI000E6BF216|nr:5-formyltetrahydrofolate cyclo-ligase [Paenibacillus sp. 1011MAR3C5]RJE87670.1 5-formyltetrahydrofolate cyclo-ligase [Paenibacillus sp. 1011MAR3C5]